MMISTAALAAALLPATGVTASAAATPATASAAASDFNSCGYNPASTVHLRTGPGTRYTSLGLLGPNDSVDADKESRGWYRVTVSYDARSGLKGGTTGWVSKRHLKPAVCMRLN
ncbi:SH3 domain-containing protein [Streptomyces lavendulocolor]